MTAVQALAGAPSHHNLDWNQINWRKVKGNVRRLQTRIVKAIEAGRWGKAKALQRLLTHSFSAKALAVRRVTENQGKRTSGVDGEIWDTPGKKAQGIACLRQHGYRAQPLRRTYILKSNGKKRPLGIATMKDRAMQTLYKLALDPIAETTGDPNSYGFREKRSPADAIAQCFLCLRQKSSGTAILEADIQGCFDNISFEWLMANIPMDKGLLKQWLKAGYLDRNVFHETENGTPQGSPISPVLANLALDGLEAAAIGHFSRRLRRQRQIHLVRFADDFVVFGRSKELLETDIKPRIESFLAERGLTLSPEKTKVTTIEERIRFLSNDTSKSNGFLVAGVSWSQTATIQKEETNMTGQADLAGIERYVTTEMARLRIPGLALGIVHGDRIVEARGFGVADSSGRAVTAQTPFYIGSLTKSFVALAVMQLVEAGRIDLDAPVRNYLPWFQVADRQASGRITVRQLLNQTTGLSQKDGNHVWSSSAGIEEEVRAFGNVPLAHPVAAASNTATSTSASPG